MIGHAAEVWVALLVAFTAGSALGWIAYRLIDRGDYAFDQQEFSDSVGRRLWGRDSLDGVERDMPPPGKLRLPPPQRTRAADRFRARVRSSAGAAAWTEARDPNSIESDALSEPASTPLRSPERGREEVPEPQTAPAAERPRAPPIRATPRRSEPPPDDGDSEDPWPSALETWPVRKPVWPSAKGTVPQLPGGSASGASPAFAQGPAQDNLWPAPAEPAGTKRVFGGKPDPSTPDRKADSEIEAAVTILSPSDNRRPPALSDAPIRPDNLKHIKGIGTAFERKLNGLGIYFFRQIAAWTPAERDWAREALVAAGRISTDDWIRQAAQLSEPGAD